MGRLVTSCFLEKQCGFQGKMFEPILVTKAKTDRKSFNILYIFVESDEGSLRVRNELLDNFLYKSKCLL